MTVVWIGGVPIIGPLLFCVSIQIFDASGYEDNAITILIAISRPAIPAAEFRAPTIMYLFKNKGKFKNGTILFYGLPTISSIAFL